MSSLLSFAWRSRKGKHEVQVPDIAPASSLEDAITLTASMDMDTGMQDDDDDTFYSLAPETPPTPEGLKPRRSLLQVRQELGLPSYLSLDLSLNLSLNLNQVEPPRIPLLPPQLVHSPQITNSSFYSKSSSERVAESPNLAAPTTAVGALVAGSMGVVRPLQHHAPLLPPRPWDLQQLDDEVRYQQLNDDDESSSHQWEPPTSPTSSSIASSQVGLTEQKSRIGYNFDPIMHLNVSAISNNKDDQSSLHSLSEYRGEYYRSEDEEEQHDSWLLQRKRWNQRSNKERLVMDCLERLQSDLTVVQDIEATEADGEWFLNTDMDEGLLCGFPDITQRNLDAYLQSILSEMDTACPEEFFLSPTQMEDYGETHQELRQALQFVQGLLRLETTREWECKYEIRAELGIPTEASSEYTCIRYTTSAKSVSELSNLFALRAGPETIRGGDTSLFSLPEDSMTPHTSNVSMATTITTKPPSPQRRNKDATVVLKTVAILTTLVQRLSLACARLLETDRSGSPEAIRATEELKRHYLQLLSLPSKDLCTVSDAFCPASMPLVRTVSLEDEDQEHSIPALPPCVIRQTTEPRLLLGAFDGMNKNRIVEEEEEEDDLRRQVGSNDYDCNDVREGVPEDAADDRECVTDFYQQMTLQV